MSATESEEIVSTELPRGARIDGKLGCLITFIVGVGCVGLAWLVMRQKTAAQLDATTELAQIVAAAEKADGTNGLRALGCAHAAVMPTEALRNVAQRLENARATKEKRDPKDVTLGTERAAVVCAAGTGKPPTCRDVAVRYMETAKNAAIPFVTIVEGPEGPLCTDEYAGDPEKMKAVGPLLLPTIFPADP